MSLQELNHEQRIIFLMDFAEELMLQSTQENQVKEIIAAEKIKRKYLQENQEINAFGATIVFDKKEQILPQEKSVEVYGQLTTDFARKNERLQIAMPQQRARQFLPRRQPPAQIQIKPQTATKMSQELLSLTQPQSPDAINSDSSLNPLRKIEPMINDPQVQLIECPGTGKNMLVKIRNRINVTKTVLSENEIKGIITYFANQANVPVIGGILKAAVGEMLISAVISNYVGSRFILAKKSPYSLLKEQI
ncbi:MAG: hypothetical protein AABX16_03175 [Nanoarchaeota archaeon]